MGGSYFRKAVNPGVRRKEDKGVHLSLRLQLEVTRPADKLTRLRRATGGAEHHDPSPARSVTEKAGGPCARRNARWPEQHSLLGTHGLCLRRECCATAAAETAKAECPLRCYEGPNSAAQEGTCYGACVTRGPYGHRSEEFH